MAAAQDRDQRALDDALLAEDDRADRGLGGAGMRRGRLGGAHHHVFEFFETFDRHDSSCCFLLTIRFGGPHKPPALRIMQTSRQLPKALVRTDSLIILSL